MDKEDKEFCLLWDKFGFDFYGTEMPFIRDTKKYFDKLNLTDHGSYMMFFNEPNQIKYNGFNTLLVSRMLDKEFCEYGVSPRGAFTFEEGTKFINYFKVHTPKEIYELIHSDEYDDLFTEYYHKEVEL